MARKPTDPELRIGPQPVVRRASSPMPGAKKPRRARQRPVGMNPAKMNRILSRAPEVVVRITGGTWGAKHMTAHLRYIHRHGKLEGETSDGSMVIGLEEVKGLSREWFSRREVGPKGRQERSKDTVNIVFSMPSGTPRNVVTDATRAAALRIFGGKFDYVMVTHTDTDDPHVHLTALARGINGQRLLPNPEDLHHWREVFAEEIRHRGVEAEATPRELRGVPQLSLRNAIYQIEKRGAKSDVRVEELHEAVLIVTGQVERGERPWEGATKKRITRVQSSWIAYAEKIEQLADPLLQEQAKQIRAFVAAMPEPLTRREVLERGVAQKQAGRTEGRSDYGQGRG